MSDWGNYVRRRPAAIFGLSVMAITGFAQACLISAHKGYRAYELLPVLVSGFVVFLNDVMVNWINR